MKPFDRSLLSVVFGKYGEWTATCTIKESGEIKVSNDVITARYQGGDLMKFAKSAVMSHTGRKLLPVANLHYYNLARELGLTKRIDNA